MAATPTLSQFRTSPPAALCAKDMELPFSPGIYERRPLPSALLFEDGSD